MARLLNENWSEKIAALMWNSVLAFHVIFFRSIVPRKLELSFHVGVYTYVHMHYLFAYVVCMLLLCLRSVNCIVCLGVYLVYLDVFLHVHRSAPSEPIAYCINYLLKWNHTSQKLQQQELDVTESVLLGSQTVDLPVDIIVVIGSRNRIRFNIVFAQTKFLSGCRMC